MGVASRQRIFVYEYVTGGGLLQQADLPDSSLLDEGRAMLAAIVRDLVALEHIDVVTRLDHRLAATLDLACEVSVAHTAATEFDEFCTLAQAVDATLLIAPEFDSILLRRATAVATRGGRLLGPSPAFIEVASNKLATASRLVAAGVATPRTVPLTRAGESFHDQDGPFVLKPVDGAGSLGVSRIMSLDTLPAFDDRHRHCVQPFVSGLPCSVSLLCGPRETICLPACQQLLSSDGRFTYRGGELPLGADLTARAQRLAQSAVLALGSPTGYIGVDIVLGPECAHDVVVEVNPRLTTSYVGLRQLTQTNLAHTMLQVCAGEPVAITWNRHRLRFDPQGQVSRLPTRGEDTVDCSSDEPR